MVPPNLEPVQVQVQPIPVHQVEQVVLGQEQGESVKRESRCSLIRNTRLPMLTQVYAGAREISSRSSRTVIWTQMHLDAVQGSKSPSHPSSPRCA